MLEFFPFSGKASGPQGKGEGESQIPQLHKAKGCLDYKGITISIMFTIIVMKHIIERNKERKRNNEERRKKPSNLLV
jgi:hypothetical protein